MQSDFRGFNFCLQKACVCWVSACFRTPRLSLGHAGSLWFYDFLYDFKCMRMQTAPLFYIPRGRDGATLVSKTPISTPAHTRARDWTQNFERVQSDHCYTHPLSLKYVPRIVFAGEKFKVGCRKNDLNLQWVKIFIQFWTSPSQKLYEYIVQILGMCVTVIWLHPATILCWLK